MSISNDRHLHFRFLSSLTFLIAMYVPSRLRLAIFLLREWFAWFVHNLTWLNLIKLLYLHMRIGNCIFGKIIRSCVSVRVKKSEISAEYMRQKIFSWTKTTFSRCFLIIRKHDSLLVPWIHFCSFQIYSL